MDKGYIDSINKKLPELLTKISAKHHPIVVSIQPENGATVNNCFNNVFKKVVQSGGSVCYGWAIRPLKYMIEAEKHAIWKTEDGNYLDITPTIQPVKQTLFVIDKDFVYSGQVVDNIRLNISENKVVDDWIFVCEAIHTLYGYGARASEQEIAMPENIIPMLARLENFVKVFEPFLEAKGSYDSACFCGNSLPYESCHGLDLRKPLSDALAKVSVMMEQSDAT